MDPRRARRVGGDWPRALPSVPVRRVRASSTTSKPPTTLSHRSPSTAGQEVSVYIDALRLRFFSCLPTVSVWTSANISLFIFFLAHLFSSCSTFGWSNRELALPICTSLPLSGVKILPSIICLFVDRRDDLPYHTTPASLPSNLLYRRQRSISVHAR